MNEKRLCGGWVLMILAVAPAFGSDVARSVSPGGEDEATMALACPTFSWGASTTAGFEVAVYRLREDGTLAEGPALLQAVPAGARSWTPAADRCLAAGRYAWTVRETAGHRVAQFAQTAASGGTGSATIQLSNDGGTTTISCVLFDGGGSCTADLSGNTLTTGQTLQLDVGATTAIAPADITCTVEGSVPVA